MATAAVSKAHGALRRSIIQELMASRRVYLPSPSLTVTEMDELTSQLNRIGHSDNVAAVLAAPYSDSQQLPSMATSMLTSNIADLSTRRSTEPFVTGYSCEKDDDEESSMEERVSSLASLAFTIHKMPLVPFVTFADSAVRDGGYALCLGRYVLVSKDASFRIDNPVRGLTLDGGLSFVLPRLGFNSDIEKLSMGKLLALTGFEANARDMVATGLATHFVNLDKLPFFEREVSEMNAYQKRDVVDKLLDNAINIYSDGQTYKDDLFSGGESFHITDEDTGEIKHIQHGKQYESPLINLAFLLQDVLKEHSCVDILEGMIHLEATTAAVSDDDDDDDELVLKQTLSTLIQNMKRRSPLALAATFRLLSETSKPDKTLADCLKLEKKVQSKLLKKHDFNAWCQQKDEYQHKDLTELTHDEVEELFDD